MTHPLRPTLRDLTGVRFGRLVVLARTVGRPGGGARWKCACDCGGSVTVNGTNLRAGHTRSCGCLHRDVVSAVMKGRRRRQGATGLSSDLDAMLDELEGME